MKLALNVLVELGSTAAAAIATISLAWLAWIAIKRAVRPQDRDAVSVGCGCQGFPKHDG